MRGGIGQRADDLQLLDDRAGPTVIDDERQRVFMLGTNMDEVNVEPIDLGDELGQGVQFRLARSPVVLRGPVACEFLNHSERYALRLICDGLLLGPVRGHDASAEVLQRVIGDVDVKGADSGARLDGATHEELPSRTEANAARISCAKISGSSQAAKWPPFEASL